MDYIHLELNSNLKSPESSSSSSSSQARLLLSFDRGENREEDGGESERKEMGGEWGLFAWRGGE